MLPPVHPSPSVASLWLCSSFEVLEVLNDLEHLDLDGDKVRLLNVKQFGGRVVDVGLIVL
jgi:hypothetical protein